MAESGNTPQAVTFFPTPDDFRSWLSEHHDKLSALWVGFYKVDSGRQSITWPEAVDQALCYGWIDGVRKSLGDTSYMIRFTPRKPRSIWSLVNIERVKVLTEAGLMQPTGLAAFAARAEERSARYAYEQRQEVVLSDTEKEQFINNKKAWSFFQARPPSYQRTAIWWVVSPKREETRQKRLEKLIADSAEGRTIPALTRPGKAE